MGVKFHKAKRPSGRSTMERGRKCRGCKKKLEWSVNRTIDLCDECKAKWLVGKPLPKGRTPF